MEQDLSDSNALQQVQNRMGIMKHRFGGKVVIMDSTFKSGSFTIGENINAFSVRLDPSGFQPIINTLV
jgi:hypothetical protein